MGLFILMDETPVGKPFGQCFVLDRNIGKCISLSYPRLINEGKIYIVEIVKPIEQYLVLWEQGCFEVVVSIIKIAIGEVEAI